MPARATRPDVVSVLRDVAAREAFEICPAVPRPVVAVRDTVAPARDTVAGNVVRADVAARDTVAAERAAVRSGDATTECCDTAARDVTFVALRGDTVWDDVVLRAETSRATTLPLRAVVPERVAVVVSFVGG